VSKPSWQLDYDCWGCGACCKAISCPLLTEDNKCSIYETRPDFCRIGYSKPEEMSVDDYLAFTKKICLELEQTYSVVTLSKEE